MLKSAPDILLAEIFFTIARYSLLLVIRMIVWLEFEPDPWAMVRSSKARPPESPNTSVPS